MLQFAYLILQVMNRLVLVDGFAILHRAYHAIPPLTNSKGQQINAVYGVVSILLKAIQDLKPTHIAFAFDREEPTFRNKMSESYQSQRPDKEENLVSQIDITRRVVESFGIPVYSTAGYEADDVIGTLAKFATEIQNSKSKIGEVTIVTGDKDILQLVNNKIKVFMPVSGLSQGKLMGELEVLEKMGVKPSLIDDYKALVGDQSDNYKGVPGVGPKTAVKLLADYGSFEDIYKNIQKIPAPIADKLKAGEESGRLSKKLATIVKDVPIDFNLEDCKKWDIGRPEVISIFHELGFKTLLNRVLTLSGKDATPENTYNNLKLEEVKRIVIKLSEKLSGSTYAIRGTTSLVLQGIDMKVDDIDIICDSQTALRFNELFKEEITDTIKYSESDKYKSYFGKMILDGILVEIMGELQINTSKNVEGKSKSWSNVYDGSDDEVNIISIDGVNIRVTRLEVELAMFSQMGRWNAYQKIKRQVEEKNQGTLF